MSSSLHLACFQSSFMLEYISVLHLFLRPNNIPYDDTSFCLPIHLLIDIWIISQIFNFWRLWTVSLQRMMYKYLFSILLGTYLSMKWLDHIIIRGLTYYFPQWLHHFTFPTQCIRISIISHPHQNFLFSIVSYSCDPSGFEMVLNGCWRTKRCQDSCHLEEKNSIWGQKRGLIAQRFYVIKCY